MSLKALQWAWMQDLKHSSKIILLALADYASDQGQCFASTKHLAQKCGMARSSICSQLRVLQEKKLLTSIKQHSARGYRQANRYQLSLSPDSVRQSPAVGQGGVREPDSNSINSNKNSNKNVLCPVPGLRLLENENPALKGAI